VSVDAIAPVSIHASGVVVGEAGIVIRGASGAGKSSLSLALLDAAARAALFGALIGDDRLLLSASHGRLIARGHPAIRGQIEQRGIGILEIGAEPAAVVRLVVDILPPEQALRYPEAINPSVTLCGVDLPLLALAKAGSASDSARVVFARLRQFGAI
jgi:HPr kinase/phosphorylase